MAQVTFLTCHLSGTGHLVRTLTLARAVRARGHAVTVLNGGRALDHLQPDPVPVQIPPVTIRGLEFATLRRPDGAVADAAYMAGRRAAIAAALEASPPDALITELYPFGRRVLADEFAFAIARARRIAPGARILCSVRDIPEPKPRRLDTVAAALRTDFDAVLVHGDADLIPLSATWPLPDDLAPRIHQVGYLGRPMPDRARGADVLVSCGGGVLGRDLARLAAQAAVLSDRPWRLLVGGADARDLIAGLPGAANLTVEPARADFPDLLAGAACSVSLCGYNTAVELADTRTPAILVPSVEGGEQEQTLRARAFGRLPGWRVLALADLTPETLARTAGEMAEGPPRPPAPWRADQGERAAALIDRILGEGPP